MAATTINGASQIRDTSIPASKLNLTLDQISAPVASLNLNSQLITNLLDPVSNQDGATKIYVDTAISDALASVLIYKGVIDCSTNPNYPAATVGDVYVVSVAGKIGGASGVTVEAGDTIICNTTNAGGTQASVGADFNIIQGNTNGVVIGPASATDSAFALFDGTTGKLIKNSSVTISIDGTLASDSDSLISTQKAVKTYADTKATLIASPTAGDIVTVTAGGDIADSGVSISTDGTMAADSDTLVPTQKAVVTYVAAEIATIIIPTFVVGEAPTGSINGSNVTFTLAHTPTTGSVALYLNGVRQNAGSGNDYTISSGTITFAVAPVTGDVILADYRY